MSDSDQQKNQSSEVRRKIIGLGDKSLRKNYYPELKRRIAELEDKNEELRIEIAEREKAEERTRGLERQLKQSQKMEAIGSLAGGIAHDFNNILTAIIGYTELALLRTSRDAPGSKDLEQVLKAGHRARELVKRILTFSRQDEHEKRPVSISAVVREALELLRPTIPASIEIIENFPADINDMVLADPTQIHQIVMNLGTNAYHAMREKGRSLSFELRTVVLDSGDSKTSHLHLAPGPYVVLQVSDEGTGMDQGTLDRVFEPYFTTKEKGKGSGMGLAVVHGIVKNHNGHIAVYSEAGKGTTFSIYLPCELSCDEDKAGMVASCQGGSERILVVDDESNLAEMAGRLLESFGYRVVTESDPLEAFELFKRDPDSFDLVLTDMTMPRLNGIELARELLGIRGELPIVLCTGFSDRVNEKNARGFGIMEYIMKPLVRAELGAVIRSALDR